MEKNPFQIIAANYSGFSKVFRRIADSVLEHPDQVLASNIHQLGRELEIAESSIVRFCKALGYSGFSELKLMLAKYGRQSSKIIFENLKDGSPEAVSREIFSLSIETLQIAAEQLDFSAIQKAADMLNRAGRIVICGVGASASVAESFAAHLLRIGIAAEASTDGELMQMTARGADERTLFVAITKSGRNLPLVRAFELAKARGAMTAPASCRARSLTACASMPSFSGKRRPRGSTRKTGRSSPASECEPPCRPDTGTRKARGSGSSSAPGPAGICSFQNVCVGGRRLSCSAAPPGSRGPGGTGSACP